MSLDADRPAPAHRDGTRQAHRVVVVGSGFGGLFAAKALKDAPVLVTLVAGTAHHLFQPLLYQVATGVLSEGEIAPATREVLRGQRNTRVLLGTVTDVDLAARHVTFASPTGETTLEYDSLILAAGSGQSYFGNDHFARYAPGLKSIDDALELRGRIFGAFELAELARDPAEVAALLTFVIVGAGPTGVEMAGQVAELAHRSLRGDFRHIDPRTARIVLLDAAPGILTAFPDKLSRAAAAQLRSLGVEIQLGATVVGVDADGLDLRDPDGSVRRIDASCVVWAAGVAASPLGALVARQSGAATDRAGRVLVEPDCTLPGHPEVFVVGDMMSLDHLPGVAQVAMQSGQHAAHLIVERLREAGSGGQRGAGAVRPFRYRDKGNMATVSRFHAVASIGPVDVAGVVAWGLWLGVHLVYLIGFKNRVTTLLHWAVSFVGRGRSERTATLQQVTARTALLDRAALHAPDHPTPSTGQPSRSVPAPERLEP
ncbi:MAG TPA: NAD(P)/FAD-dependent oxidoreductase [Actinotalea sp.]